MTAQRDYDAELDQLIRDAVAALTGGGQLVTRWVLVYEVATADGRLPLTITSDGVTAADRAGLLRWATLDTERMISDVLAVLNGGTP